MEPHSVEDLAVSRRGLVALRRDVRDLGYPLPAHQGLARRPRAGRPRLRPVRARRPPAGPDRAHPRRGPSAAAAMGLDRRVHDHRDGDPVGAPLGRGVAHLELAVRAARLDGTAHRRGDRAGHAKRRAPRLAPDPRPLRRPRRGRSAGRVRRLLVHLRRDRRGARGRDLLRDRAVHHQSQVERPPIARGDRELAAPGGGRLRAGRAHPATPRLAVGRGDRRRAHARHRLHRACVPASSSRSSARSARSARR